jgi:hypothetical protein
LYRWKSGAAVAIAVLGVVGVGCGGGSGETTSDITKAQFTKQVDRVCAEAKKERLTAGEESFNSRQQQGSQAGGASGPKAVEGELEELAEELLAETIIPSLKSQQEQLEDIGAPAADVTKVEKMLANMEKGIGEIENGGYKGLGNQFEAFEAEAEKYGLSCKVI